MLKIINRSFKAIPRDYYINKLLMGAALSAFLLFSLGLGASESKDPFPVGLGFGALIFFAAITAIYPYSQYAADALLRQLKGDRIYIVSVLGLIAGKIILVAICWCCAPYFAPFGLVALYFGKGKPIHAR